jgi:hypothetical protein
MRKDALKMTAIERIEHRYDERLAEYNENMLDIEEDPDFYNTPKGIQYMKSYEEDKACLDSLRKTIEFLKEKAKTKEEDVNIVIFNTMDHWDRWEEAGRDVISELNDRIENLG